MKIRIFLAAFVASLFLLTACQKENKQELTDSKLKVESKELTNFTIEYSSLEALNKLYIEHGLPPVTLEELGITEDEYKIAQDRINNKEIATSRATCASHIIAIFNDDGDMNGSGSLTIFDVLLARKVILGIDPVSSASEDFGTLSWTWAAVQGEVLNGLDLVFAQRFILGTLC